MEMNSATTLTLSCWILATWLAVVASLNIASFNVQIFGQSKAANQEVMDILVKVVKRYDLILIQEIRDSSETAIIALVDAVNTDPQTQSVYSHTTSGRLGKSSSKEQYSFIYRTDKVHIIDTFQYPDPDDVFQREPYAVKFRTSVVPGLSEFVLVAIHTDPDVAVEEMAALVPVHSELEKKWKTKNILIMGDLNADCSYASQKALSQLELRTNPTFTWLISDDVDTTTSNSDCAYDRFVVSGDEFKESVVPGSARVFRFDTEYSLNTQQTQDVSDHYPIELQLRASASSHNEF